MQSWNNSGGSGFSIGPRALTPAIKNIIIANVAVFLFMNLLGSGVGIFVHYLGLNPELVLTRLMIWQPFTYMFLHGGAMHLFMNMLILWLFGTELEMLWGQREFYRFYFITGIGAGLFSVVPYFIGVLTQGASFAPVIIGASGAIYGILLAFALTWPNRTVYLYFIMPMKVKYLMLIMGIITFLSVGNQDGVSHLTHLGGLLVAWLYLRFHGNYQNLNFNLKQDFSRIIDKIKNIRFEQEGDQPTSSRPKHQGKNSGWHKVENNPIPNPDRTRSELDRLLDKINRVGYEQLSDAEKKRLYELSSNISHHQPN